MFTYNNMEQYSNTNKKDQINNEKFLQKKVKIQLKNMANDRTHTLIAAYKLLNLKHQPVVKQFILDKHKIIETLSKVIVSKNCYIHQEYIGSLEPLNLQAIQFYQTNGYVQMNSFLRTGKIDMQVMDCAIKKLDVVKISPSLNPKKLIDKSINKNLKNYKSCAKSHIINQIEHIKKVKQSVVLMYKIINNAKPKIIEDTWIYRGEKNIVNPLSFDQIDNVNTLKKLTLKKGSKYKANGFNSFSLAPWTAVAFADSLCCIFRLKLKHEVPYLVFEPSEYFQEWEVLLPPSVFVVKDIHYIMSDQSSEIKIKVYDIEYVKTIPLSRNLTD